MRQEEAAILISSGEWGKGLKNGIRDFLKGVGENGLRRKQMPVRGLERMLGIPKNNMRSRQRPWNGQPDSRIRKCGNKCYSAIYKSRGAFLHVKVVLPDITNLVPGGRSTTEKSRWRRIGHRIKKTFSNKEGKHCLHSRRNSGRSHLFPPGTQEQGGAPGSGRMLRQPGMDTACREP